MCEWVGGGVRGVLDACIRVIRNRMSERKNACAGKEAKKSGRGKGRKNSNELRET